MKKLFLLLSILYSLTMTAQNLPLNPDFAYPKKVKSDALADYKKALATRDGDRIVNSLVAYEIAVASIDRDSVQQALQLIDETRAMTDAPTSSILNILLADIYSDIYSSARHKYDRREIPESDTADDNFLLWSGEQFQAKINALVTSALVPSEKLKEVKLSKYSRSIKADAKTLEFYPTVYDFVASKAIKLINGLSPMQHDFSINLLCRYDFYTRLSFNYQSPEARRILSLYSDLLKFHEGDAAPFIITDINRINFVSRNLFDSTEETQDKRSELLYELYEKFKSSPYSGEALIELDRPESTDTAETAKYFSTLTKYLSAHPGYFRTNCLKNTLADVSRPVVQLSFPRTIVPGSEMKISVKAFNTPRYELLVYKVPYSSYSTKVTGGTPVKRVKRAFTEKAPFYRQCEETVVIDQPGTYAIVPVISGSPALNRFYEVTQCTNLAASTSTFAGKTWGYVTNPLTGEPASKDVTLTVTGNRDAVIGTIPVNDDGITPIPGDGYRMYAKSGADRSVDVSILRSTAVNPDKTVYGISPFTDLAIYHPGDTVQWSAVVQSASQKAGMRAVPGIEIEATLRGANYELLDTVTSMTDDFGRARGVFTIPKDGLTGYYSMQFRHIAANGKPSTYGSKTFMVSDYKLPTYKVEIIDVLRDSPQKGDVTVKGKAESYAGFPIADSAVSVNLSGIRRSWWRETANRSFYTTELSTAADGTFSVTFPAELLASSPIQGGIYSAEFNVTSPSGENQSAKQTFTLGKPYILTASLPENINAATPVKFAVELADLMNRPVNKPVEYTILKDSDAIASGIIEKPNEPVNLDKVPSGTYNIVFNTVDRELADTYTAKDVNIYRPDDALPPVTDEPIWLPQTNYVSPTGKISILYGTRADTCRVLYVVSTSDSILAQKWIKVGAGMHHFDYELPEGVEKANVTLFSVNNYETSSHSVDVVLDKSIKKINLAIESFRDKIMPGEKETWKIKVTDRSGNGSQAAVILDMYCKALDELQPYSLAMNPLDIWTNRFRISSPAAFGYMETYFSDYSGKHLKCVSLQSPAIRTWNKPYYLEEVLLTVRTTSARVYGASMPLAESKVSNGMMKKMEAMDDMVLEESAVETADLAAADFDSGTGASGAQEDTGDDFQYRPAEIPLAFFEPSLTTDADGAVEFSFTAPNANTTWQLCALAFNKELLSASLSREIISSKPVMVQPNLPRFLRTGDRATVSAMVMNNADSILNVTTVVEIFEPVSGKVLNRFTYSNVIAAGESATVSTEINAPAEGAMLGYRIKSATENFADGEQSILPVLSSIAPVIDTTPFYIPAGDKAFELNIPEIKKDATVTLQYCNNPSWYVVTALPGLRKDDAKDALSQSAAIFSAAVAEGIINKDGDIAAAIKEWTSNPADSTLISMLEKNSDLKTILLNATPWSLDAKNQSERMARLALLFDKEKIESTYESAIQRLSKLECAGGGWAWTEHYIKPSGWITQNILANLGRLKQIGFGPKNARLDNMTARAVGYMDREAAETLKHSPKATDINYVMTRDYYKEIRIPSSAMPLINNTLASLKNEWKNYDAPMKAIAAIILSNHNEKSTARQIVASLREYAVSSPEKGVWFPSLDNMTAWSMGKVAATSLILDAFSTVEPNAEEIDGIRQWLILQKEAKDWGTSVSTSDAIYSILASGSSWTRRSSLPEIKIGKKAVKTDGVENRLGYFRSDISDLNPSKSRLTVKGHDSIPSWGAIFVRYKSEMSEIKAAGCDDVSIDKQLYKRINTPDGVKWIAADSMTVGDIVQVNLIIETKRDMDFVTVIDDRGACFEPVEQLPSPLFSEGIYFYRENRDASTNIFVDHLPKGVYRLSYELNVNNAGRFSAGVATIQSQYAPALTAHSAGAIVTVE